MNLISLDIRMLRSLISVVDTGSITETARRLGRTQPAITLQLQRLEELNRQGAVPSREPAPVADVRRRHRPHLRQIDPAHA